MLSLIIGLFILGLIGFAIISVSWMFVKLIPIIIIGWLLYKVYKHFFKEEE